MTISPKRNLLAVEYLLRISCGLAFLNLEKIGATILKMTAERWDYYGVQIALSAAIVIAMHQLGKSALIRDIKEICFYDLIVQIYGLIQFIMAWPVEIYMVLANAVLILKFLRLVWWGRTTDGELLAAWPVFGALGYFAKDSNELDISRKQKISIYLSCLGTLAVSFVSWWFFDTFPMIIVHSMSLMAVLIFAKRAATDIQNREDQRIEHGIQVALLEARTKMDADIKERNEELCHATHDVKGPLDAMIDLVNELKACTDVETAHVAALHVQIGLHELGDKLDEIIAMARITTKKMTATDEIISIEALRYHFRDQFKSMADRRDIVMGVDDGEFWVKSNQYLLYRIIGNLMMNAIVHGKPKTKVRLAIHCSSQFCYIRICDTGPGIPHADGPDRAANFANVAMANRSNVALSKALGVTALSGHGLGLRGVMRMSKTLGMPITLVSRPGKGTIVRLKVPLATPEDIAHKRKESAALFAEPRGQ